MNEQAEALAAPWSVAVVIPAFNREKFIGEVIESALTQTLPPDEVIVVDDGSTDRTADVVRRFGARVRLICIPNTGVGPSRPRNVGVAAARSRYVSLLDSDDTLLPTYLEETANLFIKEPGLGLVFCKTLVADRTDSGRTEAMPRGCNSLLESCQMREVSPDAFIIGKKEAYSTFCKGNFVGTATGTTIPRNVWAAVGGYDDSGELRTSNDFDFMFKVFLRYDIGYIAKPLAIYYRHDQNISSANLTKEFKDYHSLNVLKVLRRQLELPLCEGDRATIFKEMADGLISLAFGYRTNRNYGISLACYLKSLRYRARWKALEGILKIPPALVRDIIRDVTSTPIPRAFSAGTADGPDVVRGEDSHL
jgi:glycosyltransferase involved in cell wall biosynthesis